MGVAISDLLDGVRPLSGDIITALRSAYNAEEVIELPSPPKNEDGSIAYPAGT